MEPLYTDNLNTFYCGESEQVLSELPENFIQSCVTSPPYFGLRDYGVDGQIGNESTPAEFVDRLVGVFRQVRRVLRPDGTLWLNLGDSYNAYNGNRGKSTGSANKNSHDIMPRLPKGNGLTDKSLKQKDLMGIPWRVALALQADGWWLRDAIIWHKPSAMPKRLTDRTTDCHEYVFLLTKSPKYFFDHVAIREPAATAGRQNKTADGWDTSKGSHGTVHRAGREKGRKNGDVQCLTRNARSVWSITTSPFKGAHYATFPPKLVERCLLAGTSEKGACSICGAPWKRVTEKQTIRRERPNAKTRRHNEGNGVASCDNTVAGVDHVTIGWERTCDCQMGDVAPCVVLDPFIGSGTTAMVANQLGHQCVGIDLSAEYLRKHAIARVQS